TTSALKAPAPDFAFIVVRKESASYADGVVRRRTCPPPCTVDGIAFSAALSSPPPWVPMAEKRDRGGWALQSGQGNIRIVHHVRGLFGDPCWRFVRRQHSPVQPNWRPNVGDLASPTSPATP